MTLLPSFVARRRISLVLCGGSILGLLGGSASTWCSGWSGPPGSGFFFFFFFFFFLLHRVGCFLLSGPRRWFVSVFSEVLHWWIRGPSRGLGGCLVCAVTELGAIVAATLGQFESSSGFFADHSVAVLPLWFAFFVVVCLCACVLVVFYVSQAVLAQSK